MAITVRKGNFTLGFTIPTRDQIEQSRLKRAATKKSDVLDDTIKNMFGPNPSGTPTQDYMSAVTPANKKLGQYASIFQSAIDKDVQGINDLQNMHKKINTVPYSNITDKLSSLQKQLQNGDITGSAFAVAVANLYKQMYDPKSGVLTDDNVLRFSALDESLKNDVKSFYSFIGGKKDNTLKLGADGTFTSQLDPQAQAKKDFMARVDGIFDFSDFTIKSVRENQARGKFADRPLASIAKDFDLNLSNTFEPMVQELAYAALLGEIQKTNPDAIVGHTDGLNALGIQSDDINLGVQNRVRVIVREALKRTGQEFEEGGAQEDDIVSQVLGEIAKKVTALKEGDLTDEDLAAYSDAGLKAEDAFNQISKNIDMQFMMNVKSISEVDDLLVLMKDELNIEELIENSDRFDETQKQLLLKKLDSILVGAFVNKGAAGSSEQVLLGKGLIVMTKFLEDLGLDGVDPAGLASTLKITEDNQDLWTRAMKRISAAKRDAVAILEENPELKKKYNNYFDPFDVADKYTKINLNLSKALVGETVNLADNETITEKEKEDLLSVLEKFNERSPQGRTAVAEAGTPTGDSELGYTVNDNEINEFKTAAIETIMKYNMLEDMQMLNRFIANYTLEIDENMSVEQQDKFKDMVLNTINTDSAAV
jgi:hypothetical protein